MSRSYKHQPICKKNDYFHKRQSNRIIRQYKEMYNYSFYKKVYQAYNICDYISYYSYNMFCNKYQSEIKSNDTILLNINEWFKYYKRK